LHKLSQNRELQIDTFGILIDETFNLHIFSSIKYLHLHY
jgi:hypothetical protein